MFTTDSAGWAATKALQVDALRRLGEAGIRPMLAPAEVAGAVGVFVGLLSDDKGLEWLGLLGGIGLLVTMVGAVIYHLKGGDAPKEAAPAVVLAVLCVLYLVASLGR